MGISKAVVAALLTLALVSCASMKIPPPANSESTLLALPFVVDSQSQRGGPLAFHYIYDIVSVDGGGVRQSVVFKQSLEGDVLLVDTLPPGKYKIAALRFVPAGSGDHTYGVNRQSRNDRFTMEAGKITMAPKVLIIRRFNAIPGRGGETSYTVSIEILSHAKRQEIIATLKRLPNFDLWELQVPQ